MAILKNINEPGTDFNLLFKRNDYVTDPLKTKAYLFGALKCCPENFPKMCRSLKRISHQENSKMIRHFVVSISPCDEGKLPNTEMLKVARKASMFFNDRYVVYAIHTNTAHTHFHVLVCNTRISDGSQMSMSDSDLNRFKEHCSSVLREYGLKPIEKMDKSNELLEIDEALFPQPPAEMSQEERVNILYEGVDHQKSPKPYYGNYRSAPVQNYGNTTINVILPPGMQGTLFQGRNGQPCLSFKPSPYYGQYYWGNIPNNNAVYGGSSSFVSGSPQLPSNFPEWNEEEPEWLKQPQLISDELDEYEGDSDWDKDYFDYYDDNPDYDDEEDYASPSFETVPSNSNNGGGAADTPTEKVDPFVFRDKPLDKVFPHDDHDDKEGEEKICPIIFRDSPKKF